MNRVLYALKAVKQRGIGFLFTYFRESILFDLLNGTKTSARVPKDEQTISSAIEEENNGLLYVASFTSVIKNSLRRAEKIWGETNFAKAQFFDLGCGKGKAVMIYAQSYSKQSELPAIGIEYDPLLVEVAKVNLHKCNIPAQNAEIYADSATNILNYISSDRAIIYLYNSFQGETFKEVLNQIKGLQHVLIYIDPVEKALLEGFGYEIAYERVGKYNADTWLIAKSQSFN